MLNEVTKLAIVKMDKSGKTSREIATLFNIGKSTVGDFLRKETYISWWSAQDGVSGQAASSIWDGPNAPTKENAAMRRRLNIAAAAPVVTVVPVAETFKIVTSTKVADDCTHFMIPDTQVKPGIDMSYLDWVGKYMADKQPAVIVHIGDHADMPSLSSYDKGTKKAEGKRIHDDIAASTEGMRRLLKPIYDVPQTQLREHGKVSYKPKMVLTLGNHEERIMRHVNANPELAGFMSYDNLRYAEFGWEVIDFLVPYNIHGVNYVHYMANPMTGRPYGGQVLNILKQVGESFVMGHKQCLDVATRFLPASGRQQWGIIAGACYAHDEDYKGPQGNKHWRGVVMLHNVKDGNFNIMTTNLTYLESRYG